MKKIITHLSPDLDALTGCWLIKKYLPGWAKAQIVFTSPPPNQTTVTPVDQNCLYVDIGNGQFDHHQTNDYTSASRLIFNYLHQKKFIPAKIAKPLDRFIDQVTFIDQFQECLLPNPTADFYDLAVHQIIAGLKNLTIDNQQLTEVSFIILDSLLQVFIKKFHAEKEIKKGIIIRSRFGKVLAIQTNNSDVPHLAQKMGYVMVVKKNPTTGFVGIYARPDSKINLKPLYSQLIRYDSPANWFLHASLKILLNGSAVNPKMKPTNLSFLQLIAFVKKL